MHVIKVMNIYYLTGIDVGHDLLLALSGLGALLQEDDLRLHFGTISTWRLWSGKNKSLEHVSVFVGFKIAPGMSFVDIQGLSD